MARLPKGTAWQLSPRRFDTSAALIALLLHGLALLAWQPMAAPPPREVVLRAVVLPSIEAQAEAPRVEPPPPQRAPAARARASRPAHQDSGGAWSEDDAPAMAETSPPSLPSMPALAEARLPARALAEARDAGRAGGDGGHGAGGKRGAGPGGRGAHVRAPDRRVAGHGAGRRCGHDRAGGVGGTRGTVVEPRAAHGCRAERGAAPGHADARAGSRRCRRRERRRAAERATGAFGAGRHLLTVGALGLAIYAVMGIAGRAHCGRPFETRAWFPLGAILIAVAALVRAFGQMELAALLWTLAWLLFVIHMAPLFWRERADGRHGCKGTAIPEIPPSASADFRPDCGKTARAAAGRVRVQRQSRYPPCLPLPQP